MAVFNYSPSYGSSGETTPRLKSVRFGDGYEQRQPDGINTMPVIWSVSFSNRDSTEIDAIEAFLRSCGGVTPFTWTPPRAAASGKFICRKWSRTPVGGTVDSLSATFEQVFDNG